MKDVIFEKDEKFYLASFGQDSSDVEISKGQYNRLEKLLSSTGNSEADIIRLHQEQDPASEFYKGKPVDNESEEPVVQQFGGYDLTPENVKSAQEIDQPKGTTAENVKSTEEVTTGKKPEAEEVKTKPDAGNAKRG